MKKVKYLQTLILLPCEQLRKYPCGNADLSFAHLHFLLKVWAGHVYYFNYQKFKKSNRFFRLKIFNRLLKSWRILCRSFDLIKKGHPLKLEIINHFVPDIELNFF